MIRVLFGSALPVLGLGVAAAILGPNLVTGPRGEPIIMAAPGEATLQAATYDGETCPAALLFALPSGAGQDMAGTRIVAFALRSGEKYVVVGIEDLAGGSKAPTVVLVFDNAGRLVAAGDPQSLDLQAAAKHGADCAEALETPRAPI